MKSRMYLGKRDNLIICKESENEETPPYAVEDLSVLFILSGKIWSIQEIKIELQQPGNASSYIWILGAANILGYWIAGDVLEKSMTHR